MLTFSKDYETEIEIPLRVKNVPHDIIVLTPPPQNITIKVRDKGSILASYVWFHTFYPISVEFSDFQKDNGRALLDYSRIAKQVEGQLKASSTFTTVDADSLDIYYVLNESVKLPVVFRGSVKAENQYEIGNIQLRPDSVMVYSSKSLIDSLPMLYTEQLILNGLTDTTRVMVSIDLPVGVKIVPQQVEAIIPVASYTEKTIEVPVVGIHFPSGILLRTFPSQVKVIFNVNIRQFNTIKEGDFKAIIDYNQIKDSAPKKVVPLIVAPEGVTTIRVVPKELDYLIEKYTVDGD